MEDLIVLDVQDDGKGFAAPADGRSGGYGLTGMRERAEGLQGSLLVESVAGEGTTISITLPMVPPVGGDTSLPAAAS
jgi:signal transduction histidine kinase